MVREKILVVDDEIHPALTQNILNSEYEVITARSGKEAIDILLGRNGNVPALVLLDIMMPDMDGWETFNRLKAISCLRDIPTAFFTSLTETTDEERAYRLGAADYIKKPYNGEDLLDGVKKIIGKNRQPEM